MHPTLAEAFLLSVSAGLTVSFIKWCIAQEGRTVEDGIRRLHHTHIWGRHGGSLKGCGHDDCTSTAISDIDLAL